MENIRILMKFKSMKKNLIAITGGLILASVFLWLVLDTNLLIHPNTVNNVLGYSDKTTHPDLTREIISFYELSTGKKFIEEEKQWVIQGSIDEALVLQKQVCLSYLG